MDKISDDILIEALKKAKELQLDLNFITILEMDILRRKGNLSDLSKNDEEGN